MRAVGNKLIVKLEHSSEEKKTKGGIYLPETNVEKERNVSQVGEVVSFGADVQELLQGDLKTGDKIVFNRYAGGIMPKESLPDTETHYYRWLCYEDVISVIDGDK